MSITKTETVSKELHDAVLADRDALLAALKKYADCRHGCSHCACTDDARSALYPYLRRETMISWPNMKGDKPK